MAINQAAALRVIGPVLDDGASDQVQLLRDPKSLTVWWRAAEGTGQVTIRVRQRPGSGDILPRGGTTANLIVVVKGSYS